MAASGRMQCQEKKDIRSYGLLWMAGGLSALNTSQRNCRQTVGKVQTEQRPKRILWYASSFHETHTSSERWQVETRCIPWHMHGEGP
jgi:hypothetical protein